VATIAWLPSLSGGTKGEFMKRPFARVVFGAALMAVAMAQPQLGQHVGIGQAPAPAYEVRYLHGLGGNHSRGNSINNDGWIAGYSHLDATYRHAALWLGDTPVDLGALGGKNTPKNSNVAWPVKNTRGLIVGISHTDSPDPWGENWSCSAFFNGAVGYRCLGFAWEDGKMRALPTLGGTHGFAAAANDLGQIVGWAENTVRDPESCTAPQVFLFRAVVWGPNGNQIHELPILPGDKASAATAISNQGQIVGISGECDDAVGSATAKHAVLWDGGTVTELPNLGGEEWNTPTAINERGDVAGFSDHPGDVITEAFFWTPDGGLQALGFLYADHGLSEAFGMNERRQVVGLSCGAECRAFLWQDGVMLDLNELIAPDDGVLLTHAMDINDDGVITGRASIQATGERVTFVATPTGSPIALGATLGPKRAPPATVSLSAEALREILHPLGPRRDRLTARASR
jgi:probable HAF family extracellular repeat protein